jgi:hypothetical protein
MARSQSELFMQQLLGSCSDRSLSQVHASGSPSGNCLARSAEYTRLQSPTCRSSMLPSALAHRRRRKRPALGTKLPFAASASKGPLAITADFYVFLFYSRNAQTWAVSGLADFGRTHSKADVIRSEPTGRRSLAHIN